MTPAICLAPLYPELLTEEKIPRIVAAGFRHIEFWSWRDKNIPAIRAACRKHEVQVVNFSGANAEINFRNALIFPQPISNRIGWGEKFMRQSVGQAFSLLEYNDIVAQGEQLRSGM
jgi:hypothetical protein